VLVSQKTVPCDEHDSKLVYRCREVGTVSDRAYRRAYQRLRQLRKLSLFAAEPVNGYHGEIPIMISRAFDGRCWATPKVTPGHS
jgi:hypothetical protein